VLLVALGGAVGSALRYASNVLAIRWLGLDFPYGTLFVNLTGSFLIGVVQALAAEATVLPEPARLFLSVGIMGGFTTYSAFAYETVALAGADAWPRAVANVAVTTLGCLLLCALGIVVGRGAVTLRG